MSPVGGVGVNLAVADAVAAANILARALKAGPPEDALLARVQARRDWPTRVIQRFQVFAQNRILRPALASRGTLRPPLPLRLMASLAPTRRLIGRMVGLGPRPEYPEPGLFG
jgi:2-polyprenyl-6-methoxyphenol hydroxylase-like FAD-dependent oxidoreductase